MIPDVLTGNGIAHDKYNIRGIAHERTNRKDNIFMQRRLYIDEAHTALDIFHFAVFLFKDIQCSGKNDNLGNFYMIRKYEICGHFKIRKIGLRTKINLKLSFEAV